MKQYSSIQQNQLHFLKSVYSSLELRSAFWWIFVVLSDLGRSLHSFHCVMITHIIMPQHPISYYAVKDQTPGSRD